MAALNASSGLSDEELDAGIETADAILVEAVGLPVLTGAAAIEVISLFVDDHWHLVQNSHYGDDILALVKASRDYLAARVA